MLAALNLRSEATALPRGQPPMCGPGQGAYWLALEQGVWGVLSAAPLLTHQCPGKNRPRRLRRAPNIGGGSCRLLVGTPVCSISKKVSK